MSMWPARRARPWIFALALVCLGLGAARPAIAADKWICAVVRAMQVDEDGTVGEPDLGDLEWPSFFRIDLGSEEIEVLAPESRVGEVTQIQSSRQEGELRILSGVQDGRGWSLVLSEKGYFTMAITGDGAVWNVFGHVLAEE